MHIEVAFMISYFKVFVTCHLLNKYTQIECRSLEVSLSVSTNPSQVKGRYTRGICSRARLQGHAPGAKLLRVYHRFHWYNSSSGAKFPPRKMLHDVKQVKYFGASSRGKLSELENAPSCVLTRAK